MDRDEQICLCALNTVFGFKPATGKVLIENIGSAKDIFGHRRKDVAEILGPFSKYRDSLNDGILENTRRELERVEAVGCRFIGYTQAGFPQILNECEDSPIGLYVRGNPDNGAFFGDSISVVGTRDISPYGRDWCGRIVESLCRTDAKPVIVSGLAYGTDIIAHRTAVENGALTIAVMATGIDSVYPAGNRRFAENAVEGGRALLVSDYSPGTPPVGINFIRRNRIIAGLSRATILVESKEKGGGMITARQAFSYSRDVYALPGRADDLRSYGCNALIGAGIAAPVVSCEGLLSDLGYNPKAAAASTEESVESIYEGRLSAEKIEKSAKVILAVKNNRGISLQDLTVECGLPYSEIAEITGILENDGFISVDLLRRCSIRN